VWESDYVCKPEFSAGPIVIIQGASLNNASEVVLNSTLGGHILEFAMYFGNATNVTVYYGPTEDAERFRCHQVTVLPKVGEEMRVQCTTAPGYGRDLAFAVEACVPNSTHCYFLRKGDHRFHYPPPEILPESLRLAGSGDNGTDHLQLTRSEQVEVEFYGRNFGPDASVARVTYGAYPCFVTEVYMHERIRCQTLANGVGMHLLFSVDVAGQRTSGLLMISFPSTYPEVHSVSGCRTALGNTTADCPTEGGVYLTITGARFRNPLSVFIGENRVHRSSMLILLARASNVCFLQELGQTFRSWLQRRVNTELPASQFPMRRQV